MPGEGRMRAREYERAAVGRWRQPPTGAPEHPRFGRGHDHTDTLRLSAGEVKETAETGTWNSAEDTKRGHLPAAGRVGAQTARAGILLHDIQNIRVVRVCGRKWVVCVAAMCFGAPNERERGVLITQSGVWERRPSAKEGVSIAQSGVLERQTSEQEAHARGRG